MTIKTKGPTTHLGGTYWAGSSVLNGPVSYYGKQWTDSVDSPGPPYVKRNPFTTEKLAGKPSRVSLTRYWSDGIRPRAWYKGYSMLSEIGQNSSPQISKWPFPVPQIDEVWFTTALARVHFTKPIISLPNFIFELREFPKMLRDLGRVLSGGSRASDIPGAHLAWQFGWDPLISDLKSLLSLADELEKQRKRFLKAQSTKTLSGSIYEGESNFFTAPQISVTGVVGHRREWTRRDDAWYTAHWDLGIANRPPELFGDKYSIAMNALGLNRPAAVVWNAIPWSFLVDYFTNVSTFLEATGGVAEYRPTEICIMYTCEAEMVKDEVTFDTVLTGGTEFVLGEYKITRKMRKVRSHPVPRIAWDTWGFDKNLSILGSLATAKGLQGARS